MWGMRNSPSGMRIRRVYKSTPESCDEHKQTSKPKAGKRITLTLT